MPSFRPAALLLLACLTLPASAADVLSPGAYQWTEQAAVGDGPLYMIISIERQMVHVYRGDRLIGAASVSTGMKGHGTPTGEFPVLQKREWHRSNLYSNAPMPFMQRLTWDGIALHAGHNPGRPASHGCIRLPYAFARQLFGLTKIGTLVEVTRDRLSPALKIDPLLVADGGSAIVTFGTEAPVDLADATMTDAPYLAVDPAVFAPRLSRR